MASGTAVFLDTTILIARIIHEPRIKQKITNRLEGCFVCSGLIARQEFKRRLLRDAKYLYGLCQQYDSIQEINRRISHLPSKDQRKFRICAQIICTVDEMESDEDRLARLQKMTRYLLRDSLRRLDGWCEFFTESRCACGKAQITERNGKFDFGPQECSRAGSACGIDGFLEEKKATLCRIKTHLAATPAGPNPGEKSKELECAEQFIDYYQRHPTSVRSENPCSRVADLLLALESEHIPNFYTMNARESQHLCRVLGQTLIILPPNPVHDEIECLKEPPRWPDF